MTADVLAYSAADSNGNSLSTTDFNLAHERSVTFQALFKTRAGPLPFPFYFLISLPFLLLLLLEKNVRLVSSGAGRHAGSNEDERMRERNGNWDRVIVSETAQPSKRQSPQQEADQKCLESLQAKQNPTIVAHYLLAPTNKMCVGVKAGCGCNASHESQSSISPDVFSSVLVASCLQLILLPSQKNLSWT
jgi:hypothetical protein